MVLASRLEGLTRITWHRFWLTRELAVFPWKESLCLGRNINTKLLSLLPICLGSCACAMTAAGKHNRLQTKIIASENWNDNFGTAMKGSKKMVSMAIPPLILVPPIILTGFFNEDISKIVVRSPHGYRMTPKKLNSDGQEAGFSIKEVMIWAGNKHGLAEYVSWTSDVNSIFGELDSQVLQMKIENPERKNCCQLQA